MKKLALLISFSLFVALNAQPKLLTMEDVVFNSYYSLAPKNFAQLNFIKNSDYFYYVFNNNLTLQNPKEETKNNILSLDELNNLLSNFNIKPLRNFPNVNFLDPNNFVVFIENTLLKYDILNKKLSKLYTLPNNAENIEFSDDFSTAAFTIENNIFYSKNGNVIQLTFEKNKDIIYGHSVHRNEFGINKGIFIAPNNNLLAFYRMDQTMVTDYPILELDSLPAKVRFVKYPMAGGISHQVTIGVYNYQTKKIIYLNTGLPKDKYLTSVTFSPDSKFIFVGLLNRDQNYLELCKFDAITGEKIKTLFTESDDKFVEPEHPLHFLPNSNDKFIWLSKRDGWNHLYLYDINGNLIKQLTKGEYEVTEIIGFDKDVTNLYYLSTEQSPLERHAYKLNINSLTKEKLTEEKGTNEMFYGGGEYYIIKLNSINTPNKITLKNLNSKTNTEMLNAENPLKDYAISYPKIIKLSDKDKFDLYARIILPTDFDSTKKYPVIFYVYGGPHSQEVTDRWIYGRYDMWFQYMAEKGFIIFSIDNRGTSFRGNKFAQATFRQLGTTEVEDQMRGVSYLKTLPYVDTTRFGVYGWSYGGFMTTSLMLKTNNTFKVGACGGAVIDWKYYEIMYTERYMDTPQTNPDGYEKANLLNYVQNLNGKLLLVHGTSDDTVVWQHTLLFAKKATNLNKPLDYYPYVHHAHGVRGKDALHLYNKISNYFIQNL